ncbi:MAG: hypothetical protein LBQ31_03720 [Bacteroidales bacterium]|nr:hypothetical protein [Bacteroidales bacterium]
MDTHKQQAQTASTNSRHKQQAQTISASAIILHSTLYILHSVCVSNN